MLFPVTKSSWSSWARGCGSRRNAFGNFS